MIGDLERATVVFLDISPTWTADSILDAAHEVTASPGFRSTFRAVSTNGDPAGPNRVVERIGQNTDRRNPLPVRSFEVHWNVPSPAGIVTRLVVNPPNSRDAALLQDIAKVLGGTFGVAYPVGSPRIERFTGRPNVEGVW